jgi:hypothetical protein
MKRLIVFILLFPFNSIAQDALLQAIYGNWYNSEEYEKADEIDYPEFPESLEAELYQDQSYSDSWELGTRDDIPETIIIYEKTSCWCD